MVKETSKPKAQAKSASKPKAARRKAPAKALTAHAEDHIDGCDLEVLASEITPDSALPPAKGGVESVRTAQSRIRQQRSTR